MRRRRSRGEDTGSLCYHPCLAAMWQNCRASPKRHVRWLLLSAHRARNASVRGAPQTTSKRPQYCRHHQIEARFAQAVATAHVYHFKQVTQDRLARQGLTLRFGNLFRSSWALMPQLLGAAPPGAPGHQHPPSIITRHIGSRGLPYGGAVCVAGILGTIAGSPHRDQHRRPSSSSSFRHNASQRPVCSFGLLLRAQSGCLGRIRVPSQPRPLELAKHASSRPCSPVISRVTSLPHATQGDGRGRIAAPHHMRAQVRIGPARAVRCFPLFSALSRAGLWPPTMLARALRHGLQA